MTRRVISAFLVFSILAAAFFVWITEKKTIEDITFFVAENPTAQLNGDVKIKFKKEGNDFVGNLFLPACVSPSGLSLFWDEKATVRIGDISYNSGNAPVPNDDESITYSVRFGGESADFTLTTMQGSENVEGLFLQIDDRYNGSEQIIEQMYSDKYHNTDCYGAVTFLGQHYDMKLNGHGNSSWRLGDKKSFNLSIFRAADAEKGIAQYKISDSVSFIDGIQSDKWILLANFGDCSLMRNKIGYDLACKMGIGIENRYVDLWLNGEFLGNYLMTPKIDYLSSEDGYMLELDNVYEEENSIRLEGLRPYGVSQNVITVKALGAGAVAAGETVQGIQDWMQNMLNAVMDSSSDKYTEFVDVDSWAKFYLIQEYCKNFDVICGSIYMYRSGLGDDCKLTAGPLWDLDVAWGRSSVCWSSGISESMQKSAEGWYIDSIFGETSFLKYLGMHSDFIARVYELFCEYEDELEDVSNEIVTLKTELADSAGMNFTLWDAGHSRYNHALIETAHTIGTGRYALEQIATETWDDYVTNLQTYVNRRFLFLKDALETSPLADTVMCDIEGKGNNTYQLSVDVDADEYQWQFSQDGEDWADIEDATGDAFTVKVPSGSVNSRYRCMLTYYGVEVQTAQVATVRSRASVPSMSVKF